MEPVGSRAVTEQTEVAIHIDFFGDRPAYHDHEVKGSGGCKEVQVVEAFVNERVHCRKNYRKYSGLAPAITALMATFSTVAVPFLGETVRSFPWATGSSRRASVSHVPAWEGL